MNESSRRRGEPRKTADPVELLPVPAAADLPPDRRQQIKEQLMREISEVPSANSTARRVRRTVLPAMSAALVAGLAIAAVVMSGEDRAPSGTAGGREGRVPVASPSSGSAVLLLDRIARVAAEEPVPQVRSDQYVYVRSRVAFTVTTGDVSGGMEAEEATTRLTPLHEREVWLAQDPAETGLIEENGERTAISGSDDDVTEYLDGKRVTKTPEAGFAAPTYQFLASLPTDPDALLQRIHDAAEGHGTDREAEAFVIINDLLAEQIAPPKVAAALYHAAAKIPGVTVIPDAVDAAGRHGIAVARVDRNERSEWIFDTQTLKYLGQRSYLVQDSDAGPKGTLTSVTAVLARGVADTAGGKAVLIP